MRRLSEATWGQLPLWTFIQTLASGCAPLSYHAVPGFDGLDGVYKRLFQNALADGPDDQAEQPSLEVLALADDDHINVGRAVGLTREVVGVARRASPQCWSRSS